MNEWSFGSGSNTFETVFWVIFGLVALVFVAALLKLLARWIKNNNSPRLTENAEILGKRTDMSHHTHDNMGHMSGSHGFGSSFHTTYFVTFQVENGERKEFQVRGNEYGLLIEGDRGRLTSQGTRYLGFEQEAE